ncbi:hypothetical protein ACFYW6_06960 [Streptomyces sp. NPDC002659]|uniref:hypothetical protein n=1 Tax=Streptomyces sp. NPDC002659 TaxID=3364656 RepID=UPI0036ABF9B3
MFVTRRVEAETYDGTNGAFLANEWLAEVMLVSDDGDTLVIEAPGWPEPTRYSIPKGHILLRDGRQTFQQPVSPEDFPKDWVHLPDPPPAP